ncbi:MAG: DNRLRE domain-containing protein [Caldilineaceae bacterium]
MALQKITVPLLLGVGCLGLLLLGFARPPKVVAATIGTIPQTDIVQQVTITATKDNTLYATTPGQISNGAGTFFFVGRTNQGAIARGLVAFDLAGVLPENATILSATLQLHLSKTSTGTIPVNLHRVLADWGEGASDAPSNESGGAPAATGDATWLHTFYNTAFWQTPGGDYVVTSTATLSVANEGVYVWGSTALVDDVRDWVSDPNSNFGWEIIGDETVNHTMKRFDTKENSAPANRPQLTIIYSTPGVNLYLPFIQQ